MKILGIESSCDDTSATLIDITKDKINILAEKTASQIEIHKKYGGVVPEIAGRMHAEKITPLIEEILKEAKIKKPDYIAIASGPGLITGLLVGVETAKTLSYLWQIPLVSVNHIEGHIHSVLIPKKNNKGSLTSKVRDFKYPALALIASGGHTELILIKKQGKYKKIGATLDDAAGECFDKAAKILNLEYPGGPKISKHAETGNPKAINFPRPMLNKNNFDFSFSGLKTSALYWLRDNNPKQSKLEPKILADFCASFEQAIVDVLVKKTLKATLKHKPKTIILGGGVSANKKLRKTLETEISKLTPTPLLLIPPTAYCMDNATMIAVASYYKAKNKKFTKWNKLQANPNWEIL